MTTETGLRFASDIDPFSDEFLTDPFPFLHKLREIGPAVYLKRYGVWSVARYDEVNEVLRDNKTFSSAAGAGISNLKTEKAWRSPSLLLEADPPVHTINRRVVSRALAPGRLRILQETFDRSAGELADSLVARGRFDAVTDLAEVFPTEVFPKAFGLTGEGKEQLLAFGNMGFTTLGPQNELFAAAMANAQEVIAWIAEQCSRTSLSADGLGAQIYAAVDAGEVSEEDAALLVRAFLSAGVDTTVNGIALGLAAFIEFPDQWDLLRSDPDLARNAFDEIIRWASPVIGFFRTTTRSVDIGGVEVPSDAKVLVFFAGANRDPRHWEDPDVFDIRRKVVGHLGFGTGVHNCAGREIARMEGESLLRALAAKVGGWRLVGQPVPRLNNTLRGLDALPVEVVRD